VRDGRPHIPKVASTWRWFVPSPTTCQSIPAKLSLPEDGRTVAWAKVCNVALSSLHYSYLSLISTSIFYTCGSLKWGPYFHCIFKKLTTMIDCSRYPFHIIFYGSFMLLLNFSWHCRLQLHLKLCNLHLSFKIEPFPPLPSILLLLLLVFEVFLLKLTQLGSGCLEVHCILWLWPLLAIDCMQLPSCDPALLYSFLRTFVGFWFWLRWWKT